MTRAARPSAKAAVVIVRAADRIADVRRRLHAAAQAHGAGEPEPLSSTDTRLVITSPQPGLEAFRLALAARESLLGEIDARILCYLVDQDHSRAEPPAAVRILLSAAPTNLVFALAPLAEGLPVEALENASEWELRAPGGSRVLVHPRSEVVVGEESLFFREVPPEVRRYVIPADGPKLEELVDADGFFDSSKSHQTIRPVMDLLRGSAWTLVVAPPWTGKSFVAQRLEAAQRRSSSAFVQRTSLEELDHALAAPPLDWEKWRDSERDLVWLIDALDEGLHRGSTLDVLGGHLRGLNDSQKARLRVVLFARDDDTYERTRKFFVGQGLSLAVYRLLPIDRLEAERCLATLEESGDVRLTRALARLRAANLESWATHVPILRRVAGEGAPAQSEELRSFLLEALCTDSGARTYRLGAPVAERRRIAAHLAACMLLSQTAEIADEERGGSNGAALFRSEADLKAYRALQQAGPLLVRTPNGYRFRHEHAKELLAASALTKVRRSTLRRLLTLSDGRLRPEAGELAAQLIQLSHPDAPRVQAWQSAKASPWPPEDAIAKLRRFEGLAPQSWPSLYVPRPERFEHPRVRKHLLTRVRDKDASEDARRLFLSIAEWNGWAEFNGEALKIALNPAHTWRLRAQAVELMARLGNRTHRSRLQPLLRDDSVESKDARSRILLWALEDGEDPLEVAKSCPAPERGYTDYRSVLLTAIQDRLALAHARALVDAASNPESLGLSPPIMDALIVRAYELLIQQPQLAAQDIMRVISGQLWLRREGGALVRAFRERLRSEREVRHLFYVRCRDKGEYWQFIGQLPEEDGPWLLDLLEQGKAPRDGWRDLAGFVFRAELAKPYLSSARALLEGQYGNEYATWLEKVEKEQASVAEALRNAAASAPRFPPRPWLGDELEKVLSGDDQPQQRLHWIAVLCFDRYSRGDMDGTFAELAPALRERVFERLKDFSRASEFTPLPTQSGGYDGAIRLEGEAFNALLLREDPSRWLTSELIERWLPATLFAGEGERTEVIRRCAGVAPSATCAAIVRAIDHETKARDFSTFLKQIPEELWRDPQLFGALGLLLDQSAVSGKYRVELLRSLAANRWDGPVRTWVDRMLRREEPEVRRGAVTCLVLRAPLRVAEHLERTWSDDELAQVLEPLSVWRRGSDELLEAWPLEAVRALLLWLAARPLASAPLPGQARFLDGAEHLRGIRERLLSRFDNVATDQAYDYEQFVQQLRAVNPELAEDRERAKASYEALNLFAEPPSRVPSILEVSEALRGADVLAFRSEHDLAELLLECIDTLGEKSKNHSQLFDAWKDKNPHEEVLQSYVHMRLEDLVSARAQRPVIVREPMEGREVPDFLVAGLGQEPQALTVPIEIKWSHNKDVVTSVRGQLGERYLLRSGRSHGVYLVGLSGRGSNAGIDRLREKLEHEVNELRAAHPEVTVDVCFIDVQLRETQTQRARGRKKPMSPTRKRRTRHGRPAEKAIGRPADTMKQRSTTQATRSTRRAKANPRSRSRK